MKRFSWRRAFMFSLAAAFSGIPFVRGDSLWQRRNPQRAYLCQDSKARHVGDLVTIVISQSTQASSKEGKGLSKSANASGTFDFESSSDGGFGEQGAKAELDISNGTKRGFTGNATYSDATNFHDQMTVQVVDVLPNGNLVLSGKRQMMISGEERTLEISGVVRAIDIGPDNRVSSRYVSNLMTSYTPEGASKSFTRQGWMSRAVNKVWPF